MNVEAQLKSIMNLAHSLDKDMAGINGETERIEIQQNWSDVHDVLMLGELEGMTLNKPTESLPKCWVMIEVGRVNICIYSPQVDVMTHWSIPKEKAA